MILRGWRRRTMLALAILASCQQSALSPAAVVANPAPSATATGAGFILDGVPAQGAILLGTAPLGTIGLTLDGKAVALAGDRRFVIGFDRDQPSEALLIARRADGSALHETLRIAPGRWRIERINIAQRPSGATADYLRLRQRELARIGAARAASSAGEGWRQRFIWPASGRISGIFGSQRVYRGTPGAFHSGVDIAAGAGAGVVAPADGVVVLAGPPVFSLEGNLVIIDHGMGLNSAFLHLASVGVRQGQNVRQGEPVGTVGATGRATGPHLHWSMKWRDARIDPERLVGRMQGKSR